MNYIYGRINYISKTFIIIDNNGIGYKLRIINDQDFTLNEHMRVYVHEILKLDSRSNLIAETFGFANCIEKQLFSDLLTVHGIGPITAKQIVAFGFEQVINAINNKNLEILSTVKGVNEKTSLMILSELHKKYEKYKYSAKTEITNESENLQDLCLALNALGYSKNDVNLAMQKCKADDDLENLIKQSIQIIAQAHV